MWLNKDKWLNELWCGDNIEVLNNIPDESVDLIYIDPPFFSNKHFEIIWGNGAEKRAFTDRWKGGRDYYIEWMADRLDILYSKLKDTGSFYLHLDWHAVHYLKIEMDRIFDVKNFKNEIIWCYTGPSQAKRYFPKKHDNILFYTKSNQYKFNADAVRVPYKKSNLATGKTSAVGRATNEELMEIDKRGKVPEDWWSDIATIGYKHDEIIGYPTQKPEALLERIITASSNEGDIVLDAFCGCGTTIAVAERMNRKWIGIDVSPIAVNVMTERLKKMEEKMGRKNEDFLTFGLPGKMIPQLRKMNGFEFEEFIIRQIDGKPAIRKVHDYGIDGYNKNDIPIQMKNSEKIGRNVVDNFNAAIRRVKSKKGQIYAISFGKGAYEEAARLKRVDDIEIELIDMKEFLIEKFGDHTHRK